MADLYQELKNAGCETDHHESDLYVKLTPRSREIVKRSGLKSGIFRSKDDTEWWIEIPFAYSPFFENKAQ